MEASDPTTRTYTVILEPESAGGFSVHCPALPGCASQGDTRKDALDNIVESIGGVIEVLRDAGKRIPKETATVVSRELAEILKARAADNPATLSAPAHDEVKRGTLRSLIRKAGLTVDEFVALAR